MADRDPLIEDHLAAAYLTETVATLRTIREAFAVEIRNLAGSGPSTPSGASTFASCERSYERLLRLRRIHAKLDTRERLFREISDALPTGALKPGAAASSGIWAVHSPETNRRTPALGPKRGTCAWAAELL